MRVKTLHSTRSVYENKNGTIVCREAYISFDVETGLILSINPTLPNDFFATLNNGDSNNIAPIIELGDHLLLPGAIDIYIGSAREQAEDDWCGVVSAEIEKIEKVTKSCSRSGITTIVESPLLQLFSDTVPSTAEKLTNKWALVNDPATCKYVDYGLLGKCRRKRKIFLNFYIQQYIKH